MPNNIRTIKVTTDDIRRGKRSSASFCPVARAATRALDDIATSVQAAGGELSYYRKSDRPPWTSIRLPESVNRRIDAYDAGEEMKPFTFRVDLSDV